MVQSPEVVAALQARRLLGRKFGKSVPYPFNHALRISAEHYRVLFVDVINKISVCIGDGETEEHTAEKSEREIQVVR